MREVRGNSFVGIGLDESTNRSSEKHMVVIVRYISPMLIMKTCFLEHVKVHDGRATTICQALHDTAQIYAISLTKIVGLRTDGASVMASYPHGVNGVVRNDNPHIVFVHCVYNRLNLCVSFLACARIADMLALQAVIIAVYSFVQQSTNRLYKCINEMAAVIDIEVLKFKRLFYIQWLSLGNSVAAVKKKFESLMLMIEEDAVVGYSQAIGVSVQLSQFNYVALLHVIADILSTTNHLSCQFQSRYVNFFKVWSTVISRYFSFNSVVSCLMLARNDTNDICF